MTGLPLMQPNDVLNVAPHEQEIVIHHEERQMMTAMQLVEGLENVERGSGVDSGGRFVQEQQLRACHQGARDEHSLLLATGQFGESSVSKVIGASLFQAVVRKVSLDGWNAIPWTDAAAGRQQHNFGG